MKTQSVEQFLSDLASKSSTPGGGAVAALTGAQAAALIGMVCEFTRTEEHQDLISGISDRAFKARERFLTLAEADIAGFDQVMSAYRLPKSNQAEKTLRSNSIQEALQAAATPPLDTLVTAQNLIPDIEVLEKIGNANLITDIGIAALLIPATIKAAEMNVLVNLKAIKDEDFRASAMAKITSALETTAGMVQISTNISNSLRG